MKKPMIFFSDLDGTLLNDEKKITPATRELLEKWSLAGHKLVLCSGRPLHSVKSVKEELSLNYPGMYLIGYNGGNIWDCEKEEMIYRKNITLEDVDYIDRLAKKCGIHCHTYTDDFIISPNASTELDYYCRVITMPCKISSPLTAALSEAPCKCIAVELSDSAKLEAFRQALLPYAEGKLQLVYSSPFYLEIFSHSAGKGEAVKALCSLLKLPLTHTVAAGDQANDISMLKTVHTGIAMINGTEEVHNAADIITSFDNNHDGLVPILKNLI